MINTITGSKYVGSFIKKSDNEVLTILGILDGMNNPLTQSKIKGVDDLNPFIEKIEGINGQKESFKSLKLYGTRDGEYTDSKTMKETLEQWYYTREGVKVKDYEFSLGLIQDAYERNVPLEDVVRERVKAVADWYLNSYIPGTWYSTILRIPTVAESASFRSAPIGFLKDTVVDRMLLKPGVAKTTRNNYKAITDASAGIDIDDLEGLVEEFTQFAGVSDGNLVAYGTRGTLSKLKSTIAADTNLDTFNRTGKPADVINGIQFIQNDMIPPGKMLLLDGNMKGGLKHFVSPKKDLQGIAVVKDIGNGFDKIESVKDFVGSYWKVLPEGKFVSSKQKFMWIDMINDAKNADRDMSDTGLTELQYYFDLYEETWA